MEFTFVETDETIIDFRKHLFHEGIQIIAMDFECEFNLHTYGKKLCLIQVFDGKQYFIIDPLKISDSEIIKFLEDKRTIKMMYGVESDMALVFSQYGIMVRNVFDQKILVNTLDFEYTGLDFILKAVLNVEIKNKKKYQLHNWLKRPIDTDALNYALNDVGYLFDLNKKLMEQITTKNKYERLIYKLIRKNYITTMGKTPRLFRSKNYKALSDEQKIIFTRIYEIRDFYARKYNMPPFHILDNSILFDLTNNIKNIEFIKISRSLSQDDTLEMKNKMKETLVCAR